jgi:pimeloyl-ACP methyl ester carboxylesterase
VRTALRTFSAALVIWAVVAPSASAQPVPDTCDEGLLPNQARWKICVPPTWNGDLVIFAHGYVPNLPGIGLDFFDTLPDGTPVSTLVQGLDFAYATTSYRQNGLAILEGADDVRELVEQFTSLFEQPRRTFMTGVSEGGLVAALLAERSPELFTGAFAACGPIGNFRSQIDYFGHFRVLFDYFFPGVFLGTPIDVHPLDVLRWLGGTTQLEIARRLAAEPAKALQLMKTARAAFDPADVNTIFQTTTSVLQYNILGFDDAVAKLGGQPFDNRLHWYFGSSNDLLLNFSVPRFAADGRAVRALRNYNTSGALRIPLVTLHTTGDDDVPFAHELLYLVKARPSGRGRFIPLPVFRYGHCNFTTQEILFGLTVLIAQP